MAGRGRPSPAQGCCAVAAGVTTAAAQQPLPPATPHARQQQAHAPPACCARARPQRLPERIIERAVKGMLPKGRLGRDIRLHLKVYKGAEHPHAAQNPTDLTAAISAKPSAAVAKQ